MLKDDSEQPDNVPTFENKDSSQSFSPTQLKELSSNQPEDFELTEGEMGQISGSPQGPNWFKQKQEGSK